MLCRIRKVLLLRSSPRVRSRDFHHPISPQSDLTSLFNIFMSVEEDLLGDAAALFGDATQDEGVVRYGPLVLTVAPKVSKIVSLLRWVLS